MPRPFYIIGHNPNKVEEALEYLRRGANALEPDIHWQKETGRFRVSHYAPCDTDPFLEDYLEELKQALKADRNNGQQYHLALVMFDLKSPYDYDLRSLWSVIRTHFAAAFPEILFTTTCSSMDQKDFLAAMDGHLLRNEMIGIDENTECEEVVEAFAPTSMRYTFAAGIDILEFPPLNSIIGPKSFLEKVERGLTLREEDPRGPELVYSWCINDIGDMKAYLDLEPQIDGIITDRTEHLHRLITQDLQYSAKFKLVRTGTESIQKANQSI